MPSTILATKNTKKKSSSARTKTTMKFITSPRASGIVFFILSFFVGLLSARGLAANHSIVAVIAFGDSIIDAGNNNDMLSIMKCNFPPYGRDFYRHQATGRFSNGKIPTDFIVSKLGIKKLLPAYKSRRLAHHELLTGVSFASGGSGYDPFTSALVSVISMSRQLDLYKEYQHKLRKMVGKKKAASITNNTLFIICTGSNDVVTYFTVPLRRIEYDINSYAEFLVNEASQFVQAIFNLGARKVGVFGIPPIGCVPSQRTLAGGSHRECSADRNQLAQVYNTKLVAELDRLSAKHPGKTLVFIDIYPSLSDMIEHPQTYGFLEGTKGCCGMGNLAVSLLCNPATRTCHDPNKYVFWDSFHPTEKAYELIVEELLQKYMHYIED